jgi:tetratricopeptide (TPR) repeat protein
VCKFSVTQKFRFFCTDLIEPTIHLMKSICIIFFAFIASLHSFAKANNFATPPDSTKTVKEIADVLLSIEKGKTFLSEGKYREALNAFRDAGTVDPKNWRVLYYSAQCYYVFNSYGISLEYANDAIVYGKENVDNEAYELLARSHHRMGNIDSAIHYYKISLEKINPMRAKELMIDLHLEQCMFAKAEMAGAKTSMRSSLSGDVNSAQNDYSPVLTNNGNVLYFASRRSDSKGGVMNASDEDFFEDVYRAVWNPSTATWDSVSNDLGRINTTGFDCINFISANGMNGLMTVNTSATEEKVITKGSDIFEITMSDKGKWSTPKRISNKSINTSYFEGSATMTADGNTMYFVTDRKGDKSATDIYMVQKVGKNWGEAKALPATINTIGRETTPFISPDGRWLFFSSDGLPGMGGWDVYVVENLGSTWGDPVNLGITVNTVNNDTHFQYYEALKKAVVAGLEVFGKKASINVYEIDMSTFSFPGKK